MKNTTNTATATATETKATTIAALASQQEQIAILEEAELLSRRITDNGVIKTNRDCFFDELDKLKEEYSPEQLDSFIPEIDGDNKEKRIKLSEELSLRASESVRAETIKVLEEFEQYPLFAKQTALTMPIIKKGRGEMEFTFRNSLDDRVIASTYLKVIEVDEDIHLFWSEGEGEERTFERAKITPDTRDRLVEMAEKRYSTEYRDVEGYLHSLYINANEWYSLSMPNYKDLSSISRVVLEQEDIHTINRTIAAYYGMATDPELALKRPLKSEGGYSVYGNGENRLSYIAIDGFSILVSVMRWNNDLKKYMPLGQPISPWTMEIGEYGDEVGYEIPTL